MNIGTKLSTKTAVDGINESILGTGPMNPYMLAIVLQLTEFTMSNHLPKQQEQPVHGPLVFYDRLHPRIPVAAIPTPYLRVMPLFGSPVIEPASIIQHVVYQLGELGLEIVGYVVLSLTIAALHLARDGRQTTVFELF
ncbi:hypothetical protein Drorol1_Dr00025047 [Drosera rotundifolia]